MTLQKIVIDRIRKENSRDIASWASNMVQTIPTLNEMERESGPEVGHSTSKTSGSHQRKSPIMLHGCKRPAQLTIEGSSKNKGLVGFENNVTVEEVHDTNSIREGIQNLEFSTPKGTTAPPSRRTNALRISTSGERYNEKRNATWSWKKAARRIRENRTEIGRNGENSESGKSSKRQLDFHQAKEASLTMPPPHT